jgi:hypothetical protein
LSPNKAGHPVNLKTFQAPLAYDSKIPLSANTIKDLTWLLDNYHVPVQKQAFLRSVLSVVDPVVEEQVSDMEFDSEEEVCQEAENNEDEINNSQEDNLQNEAQDGSDNVPF